jgi:hypothetical protein
MSDRSNLSAQNLEFLRKEAKALLKRCRSGDSDAVSRLLSQLPHAGPDFQLADVQHAVARESGYMNWADLKFSLRSGKLPADYSRPGSEGELPSGFQEWKRGVTYTVKPEMLAPLAVGRVYRVFAGVFGKAATSGSNDYSDVYRRATAILNERIEEFRCVEKTRPLHTWISAHAWLTPKLVSQAVYAVVSMGILYPGDHDVKPQGQRAPTATELRLPGGLTRDKLTETAIPRPEESYVAFDGGDPADPKSDIVMFSYGEYVPSADGLNFEPFVRRAERRARSHCRIMEDRSRARPLSIVRRQWFCATNPDIAVVHVYFRAGA